MGRFFWAPLVHVSAASGGVFCICEDLKFTCCLFLQCELGACIAGKVFDLEHDLEQLGKKLKNNGSPFCSRKEAR